MRQGLYWRLGYADDTFRDEPPEDASIRIAPPGAQALVVMGNDQPLSIIWLNGDEVDGRPWDAPIFYRKMYSDMSGAGGSSILSVVAGRARNSTEGIVADCQLWLITPRGKAISCPPQYIDQTMIELQLTEAGGGPRGLIIV